MPRVLRTVLLLAGCGLVVTACGSSSHPGSGSASAHGGPIAFSRCMRAHGVPDFPDPSGGRGRIQLGSGINSASPAFQAAQTTCFKLLPGGGPLANGHPSERAKQEMLAVSECMRAHGVTGFPDPTLTPPGPASIGKYSLALGRDGVFLAVPKTISVDTPTFTKAARACSFGR